MKFQNKNRPSPFLGRMLYEATKPGFSFLCLFCIIFVFWHFVGLGVFGLLLFDPEMTCYVSRGMLSTCSLSRTGVQNTVAIYVKLVVFNHITCWMWLCGSDTVPLKNCFIRVLTQIKK